MAGLDPAIKVFLGSQTLADWMAASRAAMTKKFGIRAVGMPPHHLIYAA
jgi:hypothetical protein